MKRLISAIAVFIALLSISHLSAYSQTDNSGSKNIVAKLKAFSENHISEKAYLHFDKPYYVAGDTIYFKAYVTLGEKHQPSALSGVLHVDLINTNNKIDKSIKLKLSGGITWGDFALPDSLVKGIYRVRAYTQWMRNEVNDSYFEQQIHIGSLQNNKIPESSTANKVPESAKPDLQFFPEGGALITGISSKIAFKAVGVDGLGVTVRGVITDNSGKEVARFNSIHLGMGYFNLTPQPGQTYKARVTYAKGMQDVTDLPQTAAKGITVSINNDNFDKATLQIAANESYFAENRDKTVDLLIYTGGVAAMVPVRLDSTVIHLAILKRHLHSGITRITLFSEAGEALSERLLFIQNADHLNLTVNASEPPSGKRKPVHLIIHAANPADSAISGHFSISVTDESKVPPMENSESTIFNYLLLTSELKGYIEQPNYYFTRVNEKTRADLDLVMLTHGSHKFEWKQLLNNEYPPITYQPESGLQIAGTAESLSGKMLANANVNLIATHGGAFMYTTTDEHGRFSFNNLSFADSTRFILQTVSAKGENSVKLKYIKDIPGPDINAALTVQNDSINLLMSPFMENARAKQQDMIKYGGNGIMLKNVIINGKKVTQMATPVRNRVSHGSADQVVLASQLAKAGPFSLRAEGALHGIRILNLPGSVEKYAMVQGSSKPMRIIVDGVDSDGNLDEIDGDDVESIDVLTNPGETGAYSGFSLPPVGVYIHGYDGILIINTKKDKGLRAGDLSSKGILPIIPGGFYKAREFYSPKYTVSSTSDNRPDLRTTIYWKPELVTDKDGNATIDYYNADGPGTYRVVVEGIDDKGNLGRQVYRYKVD